MIGAVEPQKKKKDRYNIYIDGEYAASLGAETCVVFGIKAGITIDEHIFKEAITNDNTKYAFNSAISLLSHKMRTKSELLSRLTDKGIHEDAVLAAIEKLMQYGYVDDKAYAKEYVESEILSGKHGKKVIEYKLKTKGIDDDVIEDALTLYTFDTEKEIARKSVCTLRTRYRNDDAVKQRRKIFSALSRHGFDYDIINTLLCEDDEI